MVAETNVDDVLTKDNEVLKAEDSQPNTHRVDESSAMEGQSADDTQVVPNDE